MRHLFVIAYFFTFGAAYRNDTDTQFRFVYFLAGMNHYQQVAVFRIPQCNPTVLND
jgi:hypothetical protein